MGYDDAGEKRKCLTGVWPPTSEPTAGDPCCPSPTSVYCRSRFMGKQPSAKGPPRNSLPHPLLPAISSRRSYTEMEPPEASHSRVSPDKRHRLGGSPEQDRGVPALERRPTGRRGPVGRLIAVRSSSAEHARSGDVQ